MHERIVVYETLDEHDVVIRERVPANEVRLLEAAPFAGCGPARGDYEAARAEVDYVPPNRRVA